MTADVSSENLPQRILDFLGGSDEFNSIQLAKQWELDHQKLIGAINSLLTNDGVLTTKDMSEKLLVLTQEGIQMADEGSHEFRVFEFIGADGAASADVTKQPFGKIGMSKAMAAKWVSLDKASGKLVRQVPEVVDTVQKQLQSLRVGSGTDVTDKEKNELQKRKLISKSTIKGLLVSKGPSFTTTIAKQEADLTPEIIADRDWLSTTSSFDSYQVIREDMVPPPAPPTPARAPPPRMLVAPPPPVPVAPQIEIPATWDVEAGVGVVLITKYSSAITALQRRTSATINIVFNDMKRTRIEVNGDDEARQAFNNWVMVATKVVIDAEIAARRGN